MKVKSLGMIKNLVVTLAQLPPKSIMMDVVVEYVSTIYGMLLYGTGDKNMGGTMQMDMNYAIVLVFAGETRRLFREDKFAYFISDQNNPINYPVYSI